MPLAVEPRGSTLVGYGLDSMFLAVASLLTIKDLTAADQRIAKGWALPPFAY